MYKIYINEMSGNIVKIIEYVDGDVKNIKFSRATMNLYMGGYRREEMTCSLRITDLNNKFYIVHLYPTQYQIIHLTQEQCDSLRNEDEETSEELPKSDEDNEEKPKLAPYWEKKAQEVKEEIIQEQSDNLREIISENDRKSDVSKTTDEETIIVPCDGRSLSIQDYPFVFQRVYYAHTPPSIKDSKSDRFNIPYMLGTWINLKTGELSSKDELEYRNEMSKRDFKIDWKKVNCFVESKGRRPGPVNVSVSIDFTEEAKKEKSVNDIWDAVSAISKKTGKTDERY